MQPYIPYLVSIACLATAMPSAESTSEASIISSSFSLMDWVDTIASNPEAALSVEEAIAAFNAESLGNVKRSASPLSARQTFGNCQQIGQFTARVSDAVWCINDIARRGRAGQNCNIDSYTARQMCTLGTARIMANRGTPQAPASVNCNDIARTAGLIMDRCTRGDGTVSGQAIIPQGGAAVHIQAV